MLAILLSLFCSSNNEMPCFDTRLFSQPFLLQHHSFPAHQNQLFMHAVIIIIMTMFMTHERDESEACGERKRSEGHRNYLHLNLCILCFAGASHN